MVAKHRLDKMLVCANGDMREPKASEIVVVEAGERGSGRGGEQLDRAVDSPGWAAARMPGHPAPEE